ncbi:MAG: T9SS type A sorting domain-containing protein, partial [Rhodothermaceae bacterium]|nr:T9SS type A sorting domain-containing protein [Rhodothermaceae bacterium]
FALNLVPGIANQPILSPGNYLIPRRVLESPQFSREFTSTDSDEPAFFAALIEDVDGGIDINNDLVKERHIPLYTRFSSEGWVVSVRSRVTGNEPGQFKMNAIGPDDWFAVSSNDERFDLTTGDTFDVDWVLIPRSNSTTSAPTFTFSLIGCERNCDEGRDLDQVSASFEPYEGETLAITAIASGNLGKKQADPGINLILTLPDGSELTPEVLAGAQSSYIVADLNGDGITDRQVVLVQPEEGNISIRAVATDSASTSARYTLSLRRENEIKVLANEVSLDELTATPYVEAVSVSVQEPVSIPTGITLFQNYPNPFNQSTMVSYSLAETTTIKLSVVDVLGREVRVLDQGTRPLGSYEIPFDGSALPAGLYLYRLEAGEQIITKYMILTK